MHGKPKILIFLLRIAMGWVFFYSGLIKVLDPKWTAKGFLAGAKTFTNFYHWLSLPQNIVWVDFMNKWGQLAIGAALMLGIFVSFASICGAAMMALYYFPVLSFPFAGEQGVLIDIHIIYILVLLLLMRLKAGRVFGLSSIFGRSLY